MSMDKVTICNMALAHIGVKARIEDIDTDNSNEADVCRLFYTVCLNSLLEMQRWAFACERITLQDISDAPSGWLYRYKYPNTVARINFIVNSVSRVPYYKGKIPFKVAVNTTAGSNYGKVIYCDEEDAIADVNLFVTDPNLFSSNFSMTLSYFIASKIAMPMRVDPAIADMANKNFMAYLAEAANNEYREQQEDYEADSEFITVRG